MDNIPAWWTSYRAVKEQGQMGLASRNRRKAERTERHMAGKKTAEKTGIWQRISFADGDKLNRLSQKFIAAVNDYRNNPCAETESAMNLEHSEFKGAWVAAADVAMGGSKKKS